MEPLIQISTKSSITSVIHDFALYALLGGTLGARIYFVLFSDPAYFLQNPGEILAVWRGGISIIGALSGGFLVALWYCRWKRISFWKFADVLAPGIALGQTVGTLACLLNGDSYGKPTNLPWAIVYTDSRSFAPLNTPLHPIEIYEIVVYFFVFLVVWRTRGRYSVDGSTFLTYVLGYSVARLLVEFFRGTPAIFAWGIPAAQVFSAALILASLTGFYILSKRYGKTT
ncbi:MAG: prolipoprotein diacylglyceryl transferase [Deltaproteobacteria bacterium]|nr:prolipoprotein diacylglyceryl transferase [Deltaproteobacteria bacterium]